MEVLRPASRPNFNGLGLGHGCPCLGLGLGLGGPGLDYNPGPDVGPATLLHVEMKEKS